MTNDEIIENDKRVAKNREVAFVFVKNVSTTAKEKTKRVIVVVGLVTTLLIGGVRPAKGMGVPRTAPPIHTPAQSHRQLDYKIQVAKEIPKKKDLITYQSPKDIFAGEFPLHPYIYLMDEKFLRQPEISSIIRELRGGSWVTCIVGNTLAFGFFYAIYLVVSAQGYVPPNPGWGAGHNLYQEPGLVRPSDCNTRLYAGVPEQSLKTEAARNQPHTRDRWMLVESRPELITRYGQAKFKTKDHGALAGLEYRVKNNGGTSTPKTEENVEEFMDFIERIVENPNSQWFEDGTYQGGTNREVETINVFNAIENIVAIFKKSTGEFITVCYPSAEERKDLLETGNFGGQEGWFSGRARNLPPQNQSQQYSTNNNDTTPINSFESDVMGITPIDPSVSDYQI